MYQYRITVNAAQSEITGALPSQQWAKIANVWNARSGIRARLESRLIASPAILRLIPDAEKRGYFEIDDVVVCPWETIAELTD